MKLFLSSYNLGSEPQKLSQLAGENKRAAVIANALDVYSDLERRTNSENKQSDALRALGLEPEIVDLRKYFGKPEELQTKMGEFGILWCMGGNTFVLRSAMSQSGLDEIIKDYTRMESKKDFVYAGFSAGVCVLQTSFEGLDLVDDPNAVEKAYGADIITSGLGILDWFFVPHYRSDHSESELVEKVVEYYNAKGLMYKALRDGEVIISDSSSE